MATRFLFDLYEKEILVQKSVFLDWLREALVIRYLFDEKFVVEKSVNLDWLSKTLVIYRPLLDKRFVVEKSLIWTG